MTNDAHGSPNYGANPAAGASPGIHYIGIAEIWIPVFTGVKNPSHQRRHHPDICLFLRGHRFLDPIKVAIE